MKWEKGRKKRLLLGKYSCVLLLCFLAACGKAENPVETATDWRDGFSQKPAAGMETAQGGNSSEGGETAHGKNPAAGTGTAQGGNPAAGGEAAQGGNPAASAEAVQDGNSAAGGEAAQGGNSAAQGGGPGTDRESERAKREAQMKYPTPIPPRGFTPKEEQTELVLWRQRETNGLDDNIVAELNHMLQERGYSFYLTVKIEPVPMKELPNGMVVRDEEARLSAWQEILDAGEPVDLIFMDNPDVTLSEKTYGERGILRAIKGGYFLPFSEYPDTGAKRRLRAAYPEGYWRRCSFLGENYGTSNSVLQDFYSKYYLLLNLDAAEQAGIEVPETIDLRNVDDLLKKAADAGLAGISMFCLEEYYGLKALNGRNVYIKQLSDGSYRAVNPLREEEYMALWDARMRYETNGWLRMAEPDAIPLLVLEPEQKNRRYVQDGRYIIKENEKEGSARVKIYREIPAFFEEGNFGELLGIATNTRHKEEAVELLCLMHTDEEIVQLLRYGLENVHYRFGEEGLEDFVMTSRLEETDEAWLRNPDTKKYELVHGEEYISWTIWDDKKRTPKRDTLGNPCLPVELDGVFGWNMGNGDCEDLETVGLAPYLDPEEFSEEQKKTWEGLSGFFYVNANGYLNASSPLNFLWSSKYDNYKQQAEEMKKALEEAGYDAFVEEINGFLSDILL